MITLQLELSQLELSVLADALGWMTDEIHACMDKTYGPFGYEDVGTASLEVVEETLVAIGEKLAAAHKEANGD